MSSWCRLFILPLLLTAYLASFVEAQPYVFRRLDVPFLGATSTLITGAHAGAIVGTYIDKDSQPQGFLRLPGGGTVPLLHVIPKGMSAAGITGFYTPAAGVSGFLLQDGALRRIAVPMPSPSAVRFLTEAVAISPGGLIVGTYRNAAGVFVGFVYDPVTEVYTTVAQAGAQSTLVTGQDTQGRLVGRSVEAGGTAHAFVWDSGTFTTVQVPGLLTIDLVGRTDAGVLAGNSDTHGFVYDGTTVTPVQVPGSTLTVLTGMREDGVLVGWFEDATGRHGFVAIPASVVDEFGAAGDGLSGPLP